MSVTVNDMYVLKEQVTVIEYKSVLLLFFGLDFFVDEIAMLLLLVHPNADTLVGRRAK